MGLMCFKWIETEMTKGGLGRCEFPRLALTESPLSFCRPRPTRRRVWNDRDGSFTLLFQHFNVLTLTFGCCKVTKGMEGESVDFRKKGAKKTPPRVVEFCASGWA